MRISVRGVAAGLALTFAVSASAEGQMVNHTHDASTNHILLDAGSSIAATPGCLAGYSITVFNFQECSGAWSGNNSGVAVPSESAVMSYINAVWGLGVTSGMDVTGGGNLSGEFVLAVKGGNQFSLFYFQHRYPSPLDYATAMAGVALNSQGKAKGVSHVEMYGGTWSVPEPGSLLLLGTGLLGMAMVRRREDTD